MWPIHKCSVILRTFALCCWILLWNTRRRKLEWHRDHTRRRLHPNPSNGRKVHPAALWGHYPSEAPHGHHRKGHLRFSLSQLSAESGRQTTIWACRAQIVSRPEELRKDGVGTKVGLLEIKKIRDEYFTFITEYKDPRPVPFSSKKPAEILSEVEHNLQDVMQVCHKVLSWCQGVGPVRWLWPMPWQKNPRPWLVWINGIQGCCPCPRGHPSYPYSELGGQHHPSTYLPSGQAHLGELWGLRYKWWESPAVKLQTYERGHFCCCGLMTAPQATKIKGWWLGPAR